MAIDHSFAVVMTRLNAGDQQAAAEISRKFVHRLIALASGHFEDRFRSKVDPEDVVQSAYLSFFRRNDRSPFQLSDWEGLWALLATITVRKCYDRNKFWRACRRNIGREARPAPGPSAEAWSDAIDRGPTPLQAIILAETLEQLVDEFEPAQRGVVELTLLGGYSAAEIAGRCDCSERTVGRVVRRLRERISAMEADDRRG